MVCYRIQTAYPEELKWHDTLNFSKTQMHAITEHLKQEIKAKQSTITGLSFIHTEIAHGLG